MAVANAVVAREVRRRLGGRDDVVGGERESVCGSETSTRGRPCSRSAAIVASTRRAHLGVEALPKYSSRQADAQPLGDRRDDRLA